jgi:HPr Serine kinase C-terminal domain
MTLHHRCAPGADPPPDPFLEQEPVRERGPLQLLGGSFRFESNSEQLLRWVDWAYAGLPAHALSARSPRLTVRLVLNPAGRAHSRIEPPPLTLMGGAGLLGAVAGGSNFVAMSPAQGSALVGVSRSMLRFPYHARYELIELAVFTLAARAQQLMPLHAACVSVADRGMLLMGPSGAGKSTVALHCLSGGLDFVAEDAVFVAPRNLRATGIANFLHVRADTLHWLSRKDATLIRHSEVIRRRSGVRKFEVDLRGGVYRLADSPPRLAGVAFLSARAGGKTLLRPLSGAEVRSRLVAAQPYAASQPQWKTFARSLERVGGFELRRGRHPQESVEALRQLLESSGRHG